MLCDAPLSHKLFQFCSVSDLGGSILILLSCHLEYTLDGSVENIPFILLASASLVYLLRQVARALSHCLAVSSVLGMEFVAFLREFPLPCTFLKLANLPLCCLDLGLQP